MVCRFITTLPLKNDSVTLFPSWGKWGTNKLGDLTKAMQAEGPRCEFRKHSSSPGASWSLPYLEPTIPGAYHTCVYVRLNWNAVEHKNLAGEWVSRKPTCPLIYVLLHKHIWKHPRMMNTAGTQLYIQKVSHIWSQLNLKSSWRFLLMHNEIFSFVGFYWHLIVGLGIPVLLILAAKFF